MKRICFLLAFACALLAGCAERDYADIAEAIRSGAVLGENIEIDGIDVSGMEAAQARRILTGKRDAYLASLQYEIRAGEATAHANAAELGASSDLDDVLLRALQAPRYYPGGNRARSFTTALTIDERKLRSQAEDIAAALYIAPKDATVEYDGEAEGRFAYTESEDGQRVDGNDLAERLKTAVSAAESATIEPRTEVMPAGYTLEDAQADTQLIATFSTSFAGNTYGKANRVFNIEKAAGMIDGTALAPGEEFDMNAILGPRSGETGWKEATGIRDGVYVQEYGGGVCQVSSTLYNTVLMANLSVTERTHHSWPLGYIDIGRDATISTGGPNFKFQNTHQTPVYVSAGVNPEDKKVTVSIYGRALADGIIIRLTSEKVETLPSPKIEYVVDESLAPGTEQVVREPRRGSVSVTYKEYYDANGEFLRREQVTKDKYRSIAGITHIGPENAAAAENTDDGQTADVP